MNDRLQAIRNKMAGLNLQGMIIANPINIRYLTKIEAEGILLLTRKRKYFYNRWKIYGICIFYNNSI